MTPDAVADLYFDRVRARDLDGWIALFAPDATYDLPDGREYAGTDAIRAFQSGVFGAGAPVPTPGARIGGADAIAVEVAAALPDGSVRRTVNLFDLDGAGRIRRLSVYRKT